MDQGIIVDIETTGLNPSKDKIIEIGIVEFMVAEDSVPMITQMYSGVENPGFPLPPEITKLTGLEDRILAGSKIDWDVVRVFFERASIVIAHNAGFDSSFLAKRDELRGIATHWGCSRLHIDWNALGFQSRALNYLAADHGFVNPFAHRALFDCATTFRIVAPHLNELIETSYERIYKIYALYSPYETKDKLRKRGYHWDGEERVWVRLVFERDLEKERKFLQTEIYPDGKLKHREDLSDTFADFAE